MPYSRIKISSTDISKINELLTQIKDIAEKTKIKMRGPIALPTKRLSVTTRRSPCGDGYETYQKFEMRIHKRIVDIELDDKALRLIMRVPIPHGVNVEIEIIND